MIKVILKPEYYTEEVFEKHGVYYKYINPVFNEDNTVTVFEMSFNTIPTNADIENKKQAMIPLYKAMLISEITSYDSSVAVNEFTFDDKSMWIPVDVRTRIKGAISDAETLNATTITLGINEVPYTFEVQKVKVMFAHLEAYALAVNNNTLTHLQTIKQLQTLEDILNYDYTQGYPTKLEFDIQGNLI